VPLSRALLLRRSKQCCPLHPQIRRASGAHRIDGRRQTFSPRASCALLTGNLTFAGVIERRVANLDLTLSLVMADDQAIWRDAVAPVAMSLAVL
jgi:hypothetical protein